MNKKLISFFSAFIPSRRKRMGFRNKLLLSELNRTNKIRIDSSVLERCKLRISGHGNTVTIGKLRLGKGVLDIRICGNGNSLEIGDSVAVSASALFVMGAGDASHGPITNSHIKIGERTGIESLKAFVYTSNSDILLGSNCMISYDVTLYHSDGHPVYDYDTGKIINRVNQMIVGDHVWIGWGATLLKNVKIPDDCIIGWGSVVSGTFTQPHSAICGNPAKCVTKASRKITWAKGDPDYIRNCSEEHTP